MSGPSPQSPFESIKPPPLDDGDSLIGVTLAERYVVQRLIGVGGMARVYVAQHRLIGRPLAIKVLKRDLASDALLVRRFTNEGRTVGSLGHPNIVESIDMGETPDGSPYLVLEFLDGAPLSHVLDRAGMLPVGRVCYIASQIAQAHGGTLQVESHSGKTTFTLSMAAAA
ncbi:MAG: protein kinase [Polyangiales bacterium]